MPAGAKTAADAARMSFNDRLDAAVALFFMASVLVILAASIYEWNRVRQGTATASSEVPFQPRAVSAA
jgi:carbon starvation protein